MMKDGGDPASTIYFQIDRRSEAGHRPSDTLLKAIASEEGLIA